MRFHAVSPVVYAAALIVLVFTIFALITWPPLSPSGRRRRQALLDALFGIGW